MFSSHLKTDSALRSNLMLLWWNLNQVLGFCQKSRRLWTNMHPACKRIFIQKRHLNWIENISLQFCVRQPATEVLEQPTWWSRAGSISNHIFCTLTVTAQTSRQGVEPVLSLSSSAARAEHPLLDGKCLVSHSGCICGAVGRTTRLENLLELS